MQPANEAIEPPEASSRTLGEIRVALVLSNVTIESAPDAMAIMEGAPFETTRAAEKWLKDNGEDGRDYAIVRLVSRHRVSVETIVRRTVTEIRP